MHRDKRRNASLAINAIIRGLEHDDIVFHYDEGGVRELASSSGQSFARPPVAQGADGQPR